MIEKYGLFDSMEGDEREYAEVDFARLCRALSQDGVRGGAGALAVSAAASGLGVVVAPGLALVQGHYYELEDDGSGAFTLNLTAAAAYPRIDRIVLVLDYGERTVTLDVLQGTEAALPAAPALTRNTAKHMLSLAQVRVAVGAGTLTAADIADERSDEAVCGICVATADSALAAAQSALETANKGVEDAAAAQAAANAGVANAAAALTEAQKRIPAVTGASEGHIPTFNASGNLVSSGIAMSGFHRCKFSLSGTTLTITTVS